MKRGLRRVVPQSNTLTVLAGKQPGRHASCVSVTPSIEQNLNIAIKSWRWKQPNLECTGHVRPTLHRTECEPAWLHPLPPITLANQHLPLSNKPTKNTLQHLADNWRRGTDWELFVSHPHCPPCSREEEYWLNEWAADKGWIVLSPKPVPSLWKEGFWLVAVQSGVQSCQPSLETQNPQFHNETVRPVWKGYGTGFVPYFRLVLNANLFSMQTHVCFCRVCVQNRHLLSCRETTLAFCFLTVQFISSGRILLFCTASVTKTVSR